MAGRQARARQAGMVHGGCGVPLTPRGHVEDDVVGLEDGGDDGDVGQVGAPRQLGVVGHHHVTLRDALPPAGPLLVRPVTQLQPADGTVIATSRTTSCALLAVWNPVAEAVVTLPAQQLRLPGQRLAAHGSRADA